MGLRKNIQNIQDAKGVSRKVKSAAIDDVLDSHNRQKAAKSGGCFRCGGSLAVHRATTYCTSCQTVQ